MPCSNTLYDRGDTTTKRKQQRQWRITLLLLGFLRLGLPMKKIMTENGELSLLETSNTVISAIDHLNDGRTETQKLGPTIPRIKTIQASIMVTV